MSGQETNYKQGYSASTLKSHASRTAASDAGFLLPHIKPTDKILDVGCGPGTITVGLAAQASQGSVIGIDLSESVLEQARTHVSAAGGDRVKRVTFQKADVLAGLSFPDNTFDVVYESQVFPHLPPPAEGEDDIRVRALREMRRVLKPGGVLACRDAAEIHWYPRRLGLDDVFNRPMKLGLGLPDFPGGGMPELARRAGFEPAKMKVGAGTTVWAGAEARTFHANGWLGRFEEGDEYRETWQKTGISEKEIEGVKKALVEWRECEDAWYAALQCELLAWK